MLSNTNSANTITARAPSIKDRSEIQRLVLNKASKNYHRALFFRSSH
jgi:hypothetical protein